MGSTGNTVIDGGIFEKHRQNEVFIIITRQKYPGPN